MHAGNTLVNRKSIVGQTLSGFDTNLRYCSLRTRELRIQNGLIEIGKNRFVSTTTFNGQFPGPLLRFREGEQTTFEIHNDTDIPEQLHWHGQNVPVDVDGAAEKGTP